jgi:hypothetical protein
MFHPYQ